MTTCAVEGFGRPVGTVGLGCVDGSHMSIEAETKTMGYDEIDRCVDIVVNGGLNDL